MRNWVLTLASAVGAALIAVAVVLALTQPPTPPTPPTSPTPGTPATSTASPAQAVGPASLVRVPSFGANPGRDLMYIYVPHSVRQHPAILLALHWGCATGPDFYDGTGFSTLADEYGFIVLYPSSDPSTNCWDSSSYEAIRRGGGSDPVSLMSMITYTERTYQADPRRVYVTGASAGGFMTADMLADYPDVFGAGAIFEAVPFGCPQACSQLPVTQTAAQWGDLVRNADPGYHGPRPRVQIWHGTADQNVFYVNFGQEIGQWTNVAGISQTPLATDRPVPNWIRTVYGTGRDHVALEAYSLQGVGHDLPEVGMEAYVIRFFGLDRS